MKLLTLAIAFCVISSFSLPGSCAVVDYRNLPESFWKENLSPEAFPVCRAKGTEEEYHQQYAKKILFPINITDCGAAEIND